jgi:nitroreductase
MFIRRWSPRAFDASPISDADLMSILEAARWAPSSFNRQPWRFLYALNGDADWERFVGLLIPSNQLWANNASVLIFIVSDTLTDYGGGPVVSHTHSFCAGAAWMSLSLQAHLLGYHTHGMAGVDWDRARTELGVPPEFRMEAGVAIGRIAPVALLPERLRERETPSDRRPVAELAYRGNFVC